MPTIIKEALSIPELHDIMCLRYQVLRESNRKLNNVFNAAGKVSDHFDAYRNAINVITYYNGQAKAAIRAVAYGYKESALDVSFDYNEANDNLKGYGYLIDMLCVSKSFSAHPTIVFELVKMVLRLMSRRNMAYAFINMTEEVRPYLQSINFKPLADTFYCPHLKSKITPSVVHIDEFYDQMVKGINDKEILRFQDTFYQVIFDAGEIIVTQGEKGSTAFLIEDGQVEVLIGQKDMIKPVSILKRGDLVGEVAMVTNELRTASIMAKSTCSCVAFDRKTFLDVMYRHPNRMLDMFKIFSKRLTASNKKIMELKEGKN